MNVQVIRHHISKMPLLRPPLRWLQHQGLHPSDVFVASYPRSGSTWLRFMLYELLTGQDSDFFSVDRTIAGVGRHRSAKPILANDGRLLQTHEPYHRAYLRSIYLVRDVRDVVISEYYFSRRWQYFTGEFNDFFENFLRGKANRYGFWGDQVTSWLDNGISQSEVLLIRFEDMRKNPEETLSQCIGFLGVEATISSIQKTVKNHTIDKMKKKEDQSNKFTPNVDGIRFITDGAVGKGKQRLSSAQQDRLLQLTSLPMRRLDYI